MDGPIRLGQRTISIQFQYDRFALDSIELAYWCIETLAIADDRPKTSVQVESLSAVITATITTEIQG